MYPHSVQASPSTAYLAKKYCCLGCCHVNHAALVAAIAIILQLGALAGYVLAIVRGGDVIICQFRRGVALPENIVNHGGFYLAIALTALLGLTLLAAALAIAGVIVRKAWLFIFIIVLLVPTSLTFLGTGIFLSIAQADLIYAVEMLAPEAIAIAIIVGCFALALEHIWFAYIFIKARAYTLAAAENNRFVYPAPSAPALAALAKPNDYANIYQQTPIPATLKAKRY